MNLDEKEVYKLISDKLIQARNQMYNAKSKLDSLAKFCVTASLRDILNSCKIVAIDIIDLIDVFFCDENLAVKQGGESVSV